MLQDSYYFNFHKLYLFSLILHISLFLKFSLVYCLKRISNLSFENYLWKTDTLTLKSFTNIWHLTAIIVTIRCIDLVVLLRIVGCKESFKILLPKFYFIFGHSLCLFCRVPCPMKDLFGWLWFFSWIEIFPNIQYYYYFASLAFLQLFFFFFNIFSYIIY